MTPSVWRQHPSGLYLQSTVLGFDSCLYIQKARVCIGSLVAPFLAEIYLNTLDGGIIQSLKCISSGTILVKTYMDNVLNRSTSESALEVARNFIVANFRDLRFTEERPLDCNLQYLDLCLSTKRVCAGLTKSCPPNHSFQH